MSREVRDLRPFDVPPSLDNLFSGTRLHFGDIDIEPGQSVRAWEDPEAYAEQSVKLVWAENSAFDTFRERLRRGVEDLGIVASDLSLLVVGISGYLRTTDIVSWEKLSRNSPREREVNLVADPERAVAFRVVGQQANRIEAYLMLNRRLAASPLRPWRLGTWLARCEFRVAVDAPSSLFRPTPLNEATRRENKLPKGAVRYLVCDPLDPFSPEHPPRFYVDEEILRAMSDQSRSPVSRMMQKDLVAMFLRSVLVQAHVQRTDWRNRTWEELADTLFGRVVRYLVGPNRSPDDYEARLRQVEHNAELQGAHVEDALDVRGAILAGLAKKAGS